MRVVCHRRTDPEIERECLKVIHEFCIEIWSGIESFGSDGGTQSNKTYQRSVPMCLFQIGENVKTLRRHFWRRYCDEYWRSIVGMRDIIRHSYSISCDISVIWNVASTRINDLYDHRVRHFGKIEKELGPNPNLERVEGP